MNVIEIDFTREENRGRDEDLTTSLRLHDQMLSCLDFVVEKYRQLNHENAEVAPLLSMIDKIHDGRVQVVESLNERQKSVSKG